VSQQGLKPLDKRHSQKVEKTEADSIFTHLKTMLAWVPLVCRSAIIRESLSVCPKPE
jgi:hypothetical protein